MCLKVLGSFEIQSLPLKLHVPGPAVVEAIYATSCTSPHGLKLVGSFAQ